MAAKQDETLIKIEAMASAITHSSGAAKTALQREYLELIGHLLTDMGRGDAIAFPILDLLEHLDSHEDEEPAPSKADERRGAASGCSDDLLAKVCAVIDVLVSSGYSSDHACQIVARQMIARNVQIPAGGDARAWRNIQAWRVRLINATNKGAAYRTYTTFKDELPKLFGTRLGEAAAREAIWDRRTARAPAKV